MEKHGPTWHPLYVIKPTKHRQHVLMAIHRPVLRILGYDFQNDSELLIVRVHPPYLTLRVARPPEIFPLSDVELAELPPAWPASGAKDPNR